MRLVAAPCPLLLLLAAAFSGAAEAQVCPSLPVSALDAGWSQAGDKIGFDVAAADPYVVLSRCGSNAGRGSAVVLRRDAGSWRTTASLVPTDFPAGANFGFSVATDGVLTAVGAPFDDATGSQSGSVSLYLRSGESWPLFATLFGSDAFSLFGFDVAVSGDGIVASDLSPSGEHVRVFRRVGMTIVEEATLVAPGGGAGSLFGLSVAMSGDRIAVGAPLADLGGADSGAVYVFERVSGFWTEAYQVVPATPLAGARFGSSVALEGNRLVVGAPRADDPSTDAGRASVFLFDGVDWTEEATLVAPDNWLDTQFGSGNLFGWSVAIDGDAIAVGAPGKDDAAQDAGAAYVYTLNEGEWTFQEKYTAPGSVIDAEFGYSVAVAGEDAIAGRPIPSIAGSFGAAFFLPCFRLSAKLPRPSLLDGGSFGLAVSAWGERILAGAPHTGPDGEENTGEASVWVPKGTSWEKEADLVPADSARFTLYGFDLALSGDLAAVGSPGARSGGVLTGAVYVFARDGGGTWTEERKVVPPGVAAGDSYGNSLALDGDTLVAGAKLDDDFGTDSGSVYVFTRSGGTWALEQQLFPDVTDADARFGSAVAISGDTIVVGAPHDRLDDLGVGAAYVFARSGGVWTLEAKMLHHAAFVGDRFGTSVAASGDTIAVVAPGQGGTLATSVFTRAGGWPVAAVLEEDVQESGNAIHAQLSLVGDLLALSMDSETASPGFPRGMVVLYVRTGSVWNRRQVIAANEGYPGETFGSSVSIADGGMGFVAIGNHTKIGRVNNDGAVYAYRLDGLPPVIDCPGDVITQVGVGGGIVVGFGVTASDDFDPEPQVECSPPSGSFFPLGATTVTCRATDDLNHESTCEFVVHVLPDDLFFRRGNVNALTEEVVDVLFVNDSPGDPVERKILLSADDPLVMRVVTPPSAGRGTAKLAMYVWLREPTAATVRRLPGGIGWTCLPTPLDPGGPQPKRIANTLGYPGFLGAENWPGPPTSPAPTVLLSLPAVGRSLTLFAQGIIADTASLHGEVAVTNGILVVASD